MVAARRSCPPSPAPSGLGAVRGAGKSQIPDSKFQIGCLPALWDLESGIRNFESRLPLAPGRTVASGLLAAGLGSFRRFGLGRSAGGRAGLLFRQAAIVTLEDRAILGREPLGHRLHDPVTLAVGELGPVLAGVAGVHEV